MQPTTEILERISKDSLTHKEEVFTRLYRYLLRPDIYYQAYQRLYTNKGASTKGINQDTADGFSEAKIEKIIQSLADETYQPTPVRRTYIAKKSNPKKKRPLGIPTFTDKLVQEALRMILEAIYEPLFLDCSHGFRPKRSCHTALDKLKYQFGGVRWFVEGDIKGCFDNINHDALVGFIGSKVKDARIVKLVYKFLKAGYLEDWVYHKTYSGTPQGGILSPLLANIYLHELDKFVMQAVYLLNEQTYLHLRENLAGVGYEVFDKNSPLQVEEGQITREVLGNTQRRIETARAYYLAEHQDEPVEKIQNVAVTTLEKFRSGVRRRRNLAPRSLPDNDVRFIDPQYNELFRVPDGGIVQLTYPDGHQRSEVVEYLDDYHMKIGSSVQHICEFAERMARSRAIVEPEPLTQQDCRAWNLEYNYYLTVQANGGAWEYALYQGDCCLLERGKIDAPELMIEEVRDEILYSHNLRNKDCIPLTQEEFTQKLADRNEIQSYRMKQFQQSGHDCYLVMQLQQDADPALRFAAMRYLNKQNIAPSVENYEILYRGNLPEGKRSVPQAELLEQLYQKFNFARPTDYHGHSLSVSDVIMLNQDGKISAHYVDSIGFKELPGFLDTKPERLSVLQNLKEKCDAPECNPTVCRKVRAEHEL